jgi:hypothetical protein
MAAPVGISTLNTLQAIMEGAMLDTVTITNPGTRVDLPNGAWKYEGETTVVTTGMIGPLSKNAIERFQADRVEYAGLEQLDVPRDTVVGRQSKVSVLSARHGTTRHYTVEGVTPLGTYDVNRSLVVKALR